MIKRRFFLDVEPCQERKKVDYAYEHEKTFENKDQCQAAIDADDCWSFVRKIPQTRGYKNLYRCKHCRYRGEQCSAGIYVLYNTKSRDFTVNHSHTTMIVHRTILELLVVLFEE